MDNRIARAAAFTKLGLALALASSGVFAQTDLEDGMANIILIVETIIDVIAVLCVLAGFYFFVSGIMMAIKKSKPETASQVTGGQIAGHIIGGPVLTIAGYFLLTVVSLVSNDSTNAEIGGSGFFSSGTETGGEE